MSNKSTTVKPYAKFGSRFIAFLIDTIIVLALIGALITALDHFLGTNTVGVLKALVTGGSFNGESSPYALFLTTSAKQWAAIVLCMHVVPLLYFAVFEATGLRGTPGKLVLRIEVANGKGKRISVGAAIWRHIGRYLSVFTLFIGFFMSIWTSQRQALHDMMANSLVLNRTREDEPLRYVVSNSNAMLLCGLLAVGVFAVNVVPSGAIMNGYPVAKWQTRLAMHQIKDVVKEVEAYVQETNVWPDHFGKLGLLSDDYLGGNVSALEVVRHGVVVVTLQGADKLDGKRIVLSPSADENGGVRWNCEGTAVQAGLTTTGCVRG